jgi:hypothetical protein
MSIRSIQLAACFSVLPVVAGAAEDRPVFHESPARLVECIESSARANFATACVNVTRDALQKRLRIYATSPAAKVGKFKADGCEVELIYNPEIAIESKTAAGPYYQHHNHLVLKFAAAQYTAGKRGIGLLLVKLLAQAEPGIFWSSPTHPPLTIQRILAGIEADDEVVKPFLREESEDWPIKLKTYGP